MPQPLAGVDSQPGEDRVLLPLVGHSQHKRQQLHPQQQQEGNQKVVGRHWVLVAGTAAVGAGTVRDTALQLVAFADTGYQVRL